MGRTRTTHRVTFTATVVVADPFGSLSRESAIDHAAQVIFDIIETDPYSAGQWRVERIDREPDPETDTAVSLRRTPAWPIVEGE